RNADFQRVIFLGVRTERMKLYEGQYVVAVCRLAGILVDELEAVRLALHLHFGVVVLDPSVRLATFPGEVLVTPEWDATVRVLVEHLRVKDIPQRFQGPQPIALDDGRGSDDLVVRQAGKSQFTKGRRRSCAQPRPHHS